MTYTSGQAVLGAANDLRGKLISRASELFESDEDQVELVSGSFVIKGDASRTVTLQEVPSQAVTDTHGPIEGQLTYTSPTSEVTGFSAQVAEVEVDPETGKVTILNFTVVQDAGKAIHPSYVEGQLQGGAVQGIGWALNEEYFFDDQGQMANASFLDYRMPTSLDLPMIDTVIVEVANPGHPYGVRGVGEAAIVPPMAAIANAIKGSAGVRMNSLPMTPGKVLDAISGEGK